MMFGETHYSLIHVAAAVITVVFLIFATFPRPGDGTVTRVGRHSRTDPVGDVGRSR
jgi:hypothetical protein